MSKIKLWEKKIEARWPRLEVRASRLVVIVAILNLVTVCVLIVLRHHHSQ